MSNTKRFTVVVEVTFEVLVANDEAHAKRAGKLLVEQAFAETGFYDLDEMSVRTVAAHE